MSVISPTVPAVGGVADVPPAASSPSYWRSVRASFATRPGGPGLRRRCWC